MSSRGSTRGRSTAIPVPDIDWGALPAALGRALAAQRELALAVLPTYLSLLVGFFLLARLAIWMMAESPYSHPAFTTYADPVIDAAWRWDGEWYMSIARWGYFEQTGYSNLAFFPLYPLLIKGTVLLTGVGFPLAGLIISNVAFLGALIYIYKLAELDGGRGMARRAVWLMAITPMAFWFHAAYSESLFLLSAVGTIYHVRRGQWWVAGFWAEVGAVTRAQGILLAAPLAWGLARLAWEQRRLPWRHAPALALPFLGLGAHMAYLYFSFGDALAFSTVQKAWDRSFMFPLANLWESVRYVFDGYQGITYPMSVFNIVVIWIYLAVALFNVRRWPAVYTIYALGSIAAALAFPTSNHPADSGARFMAVVFPAIFALAAWSVRWPWLLTACTALFLPLYALLAALFFNWYWVI
ncbi:MAG: mannosyltransferase family protein [Chloroflexota bacterium]